MKIIIDKDKCTGCGICRDVCPKGGKIWSMDKIKKATPSNLEYCHLCIICASKCPQEAIQVIRDDNYEKSPEIEENP